jgi:hypothetical protein
MSYKQAKRRPPLPCKLNVRMERDVMQWIQSEAAQAHVDMSDIVRPILRVAYEQRHAK